MQSLPFVALPLLASGLLAQGVPEAAEPNNTTTTAAVLPASAQGVGDIAAGDEDWFRITLPSARDYKIWTGPGFVGAIGDTRVRILAADGTEILDVDNGSVPTHGFYTAFQGHLPAGSYFVAVRGVDAVTIGSYTLDVVLGAPGTYAAASGPLTPVTEAVENNDPRPAFGSGTATHSGITTSNSGSILAGGGGSSFTAPGADYDFYRVDIATAGTLVMETISGAPAPAMQDSVIFLADGTFTLLAQNDDGGAGLLSLLSYSITSGTYYVVVKGWGTGNYTLEVKLTSPLPTGTAAVTANPGGCLGTNGVPTLGTRVGNLGESPEVPVLGSTFYVDGTSMPSNALVMRVLGLAQLGVPFDLTVAGAPGCQIEVDPIDQVFVFADAAGVDFWGISSPASLAFLGLPIEQQLAVLDLAANGLGLTVSNTVSSVFGVTH